MISVGILDTKGLGHCPSLDTLLPKEESDRIKKIKNREARILSFGARLLLFKTYEKRFNKKPPKIHYTEEGKPYFKEDVCSFSISHNNGFAVVALSDEGDLGVDIQSFDGSEDFRERVEKRFLSALSLEEKRESCSNIRFDFFEISDFEAAEIREKRDVDFLEITARQENDSFLLRWTLLEALLKMNGGGFKELKNVNIFLQNSITETRFFQHGGISFAVSVASAKK